MKRNFIFKHGGFLVVLLATARMTLGQEENTTSWTLPDLVGFARTNNPELKVFKASIDAARGSIVTSKAFENPEFSFLTGVKHLSAADGNPGETFFKGTWELNQTIEFPGKRALRRSIAEHDLATTEIALQGFGFQLELATRKAFYGLLAAEAVETVRGEQVESANVFSQAVKKRADSGFATDFEVVKAEAELVSAKKLLRDAQSDSAAARISLNNITGRDPSAPIKVQGTLEIMPSASPAAALIAIALTNHPGLRVQNSLAERAGLNLKAARVSRNPDFIVGPVVENSRDEQIYGLSVSVPLPLWNRKKGEIQSATAEQQKALAEIETLQRDIARSVATASERLQAARDQLKLYSPDFRDRLKNLMDRAEQSYAQNATSLLIYLDAKRTYFETMADYTENLAKIAEAHAELESAVGVPLE